jgi:hypothetical protein
MSDKYEELAKRVTTRMVSIHCAQQMDDEDMERAFMAGIVMSYNANRDPNDVASELDDIIETLLEKYKQHVDKDSEFIEALEDLGLDLASVRKYTDWAEATLNARVYLKEMTDSMIHYIYITIQESESDGHATIDESTSDDFSDDWKGDWQ